MEGELEAPRGRAWDDNKTTRAELRRKVWEMRRSLYTFRQIGEALGIAPSWAHTLESEELELRDASLRDAMRAQMEERLGSVMQSMAAKFAETGDWKAMDNYRWAEDRLAKLLGLDAPVVTKAEVSTVQAAATVEDIVAEALAAEERARAARDE
jgi:hypothetical protein